MRPVVATVSVPAYEGPIEALLHLVTGHQLDIFEIPLADVVEAFLAEVAAWDTVDLPVLSEFLTTAAMLVELKSKRLLPGSGDIEPDEELVGWEERDLLLQCRAKLVPDGLGVTLDKALEQFTDRPELTRLRNKLTFVDPDEAFSSVPYEKGYLLLRAIVVRGILDSQAGLKGCRKAAAVQLAQRVRLSRFSFDVELFQGIGFCGLIGRFGFLDGAILLGDELLELPLYAGVRLLELFAFRCA